MSATMKSNTSANICEHGQLRRSCETCDAMAEVAELRTALAVAIAECKARRIFSDSVPCPSCGLQTLFIGTGGHLTCASVPGDATPGCPNPSVEDVVKQLTARITRLRTLANKYVEHAASPVGGIREQEVNAAHAECVKHGDLEETA